MRVHLVRPVTVLTGHKSSRGFTRVAVVLASLAGGWLPLVVRLTHTRLQVSMSLCGGLMLGIGLLHLLPHSVAVLGSLDRAIWWMMAGLLTMFFSIRAFHFHQHEPPGAHPHDHDHDHGSAHSHAHHRHTAGRLSWLGLVLGLGIHTLIDGMALAASVQVEAAHGGVGLLGFGTFVAVLLHKPLDAVPISLLMQARHMSSRRSRTSSMRHSRRFAPRASLFFSSGSSDSPNTSRPSSAAHWPSQPGSSCASRCRILLPELEFHAHDRLKLSLALLVGVAVAYGIGFLEPEEAHDHGHEHAHHAAAHHSDGNK